MPVPFNVYADFECKFTEVESYEGSSTKKYQDHVPYSFAYKIICIDNTFTKSIVVFDVKMLLMNLLNQCLQSMSAAKK